MPAVQGTLAQTLARSKRANREQSWELRSAHWSPGEILVESQPDPSSAVVCFAPPGTPLHAERGIEAAFWRRATWQSRAEFVGQRPPASIQEVPFEEALLEIPPNFSDWAGEATASHVEALRAFAQRRRNRTDLKTAASRLCQEVELVGPGILERHRANADAAVACLELDQRRDPERVKAAAPTPLSWYSLRRLPFQAVLMASLYGLYRVVRPNGFDGSFEATLGQLSLGTVFDLLMWVYGQAHVPIAFAFLGWVLFRRQGAFDFVRNAVIATAVLAILPYLFLGGAVYHSNPSHAVPASAVPTMPALHLAISIMVGLWGVLLCRSWLARIAWLGYPALALAVVIASEPNDLAITIGGGFLAVLLGLVIATVAGRLHRTWRRPQLPQLSRPRIPSLPQIRHTWL